MSSDYQNLYAVSDLENAVIIFQVNSTTGMLSFMGKITDGDQTDSIRVVDGLIGAHSVFVSGYGTRVFVASYYDGALSSFSRDADGQLRYIDVIKDGERNFNDFKVRCLLCTSCIVCYI